MNKRVKRIILCICILLIFLMPACTEPTHLPTSQAKPASIVADSQVTDSIDSCPVTPPTSITAENTYYKSQDERIVAPLAGHHLYVGQNKVPWVKPRRVDIDVTGHKRDDPSVVLEADLSPFQHNSNFLPSGLIFPSAGCWDIEARADETVLRFTVYVYPRPQ